MDSNVSQRRRDVGDPASVFPARSRSIFVPSRIASPATNRLPSIMKTAEAWIVFRNF
jgi:hypothetical protein